MPSVWEATLGILGSGLVPATLKSCGWAGEDPERSHEDDPRARKQVRNVAAGNVQPGEGSGGPYPDIPFFKGGYKADEDSLFTWNPIQKTWGDEPKLILGTFPMDTRGILHNESNQPLE